MGSCYVYLGCKQILVQFCTNKVFYTNTNIDMNIKLIIRFVVVFGGKLGFCIGSGILQDETKMNNVSVRFFFSYFQFERCQVRRDVGKVARFHQSPP